MPLERDATPTTHHDDLLDRVEVLVGTRDLDEANRRMETLIEWRFG